MALTTTCIGAYPKPDYLPIKDWFQVNHDTENYVDEVVRGFARAAGAPGAEDLFDRATAEAVADQIACGIDIPTEGELRRENYIHYQCRFFEGFDFENLERRVRRNGAYVTWLPVDMMDKADALPTSPQAQQQQKNLITRILAA